MVFLYIVKNHQVKNLTLDCVLKSSDCMLEEVLAIIAFAFCGSLMRVIYGSYKVYSSYLDIKLNRKRIMMEWAISLWFGFMGGIFLSQLEIVKLGVNAGAFVASILGANVVDLIVKKFGFTKNMQVIVSDQQLGFTEFNRREMNALEFVKLKGKITNKVYQRINQTTHDVAKYELKTLVNKGKLEEVGENKSRFYVSA